MWPFLIYVLFIYGAPILLLGWLNLAYVPGWRVTGVNICVFFVGGILGMFALANVAAWGIPHALRFLHVKGNTRYGEVAGFMVLALGAELGGAGLMFLKSLFGGASAR